jgi:hypothetical protein
MWSAQMGRAHVMITKFAAKKILDTVVALPPYVVAMMDHTAAHAQVS